MLSNCFRLSIISALLILMTVGAQAAALPDFGFGNNGTVTTTFGVHTVPVKISVQQDGKIIALGNVGFSSNQQDIVVARYLPNGSLDPAFGTNGYSVYVFSPQYEAANDLVLQSDGKMILVGSLYSQSTQSIDFFIARLNADGTRDTSFGNSGFTTINQSSSDYFNAVAVAPDGKIVAVGGTSQNGGEATIARFTANGSLDGGFAQQGLLFVNYPNLTSDNYRTITIQPDAPPVGRIVVGGEGMASVPHIFVQNFIASRYYADGSACQGFGVECAVYFGSGGVSAGLDVEVQPDGKILTVSDTTRRFLSNGEPDPTFAGNAAGNRMALRSDGKFYVAGTFLNNNTTGIYSPGGRRIGRALDVTAVDIIGQPDDKILTLSATSNGLVIKRFVSISSRRNAIVDFDDDDKSDLSFYSPAFSTLFYSSSSSGTPQSFWTGEPTQSPVRIIPAQIASLPFIYSFWKATAATGSQGYFCSTETGSTQQCLPWGTVGDIPMTGDFDGDDRNDAVVFRPSDGVWYISQSSNNQFRAVRWGLNGDKPVPADYDYDGITDFAIFRPSSGTWWVHRSSDDSYFTIPFGIASDIPLTGDFDGDGRADFTVYRASEGNWYQYLTSGGYRVVRFGLPADFPVPGDYDGDGRHDIAVFREGVWYVLQSSAGLRITNFGNAGVVPVTVRYDQ